MVGLLHVLHVRKRRCYILAAWRHAASYLERARCTGGSVAGARLYFGSKRTVAVHVKAAAGRRLHGGQPPGSVVLRLVTGAGPGTAAAAQPEAAQPRAAPHWPGDSDRGAKYQNVLLDPAGGPRGGSAPILASHVPGRRCDSGGTMLQSMRWNR